jgi:signal transduction histidine kinase
VAKSLVLQRYLGLISRSESLLSNCLDELHGRQFAERDDDDHFFRQVDVILKELCSLGPSFWYYSACLWRVEDHQDRGKLFIPTATFNFDAERYSKGVANSNLLLGASEAKLVRSTEGQSEGASCLPGIGERIDITVAVLPMRSREKQVGVLTIYGKPDGPLPISEDIFFLKTLTSVVVNAMSRSEALSRANAQREMDMLLSCSSLEDVWPRAAKIMQRYLAAAGCMVIYRPETDAPTMHIVGQVGFDERLRALKYQVGTGQTGLCAATGRTIRWDDVPGHLRDGFDTGLLHALENSHGHPIRSWLAIPIGGALKNHGVIKVINRTARPGWFTADDEDLAESLALRLRVIVERFAYIDKLRDATAEAHRQTEIAGKQARRATLEREKAEEAARKRQEDLMLITHQLQGPLVSIIGTISFLRTRSLPRAVQEDLESVLAFAEDSLSFCYGTYVSLAREAGSKSTFAVDAIDASAELRHLCERLQRTNARQDLNFRFRKEDGFPTLHMDRNVFVSVFYSLVHNAMKYAEEFSTVTLECSFERNEEAALKVKSIGEPIHPAEAETIFEKFARGRNIKRFGRYHSGTGLGLWVARELMRAVGGDISLELSPEHPTLSVFVVHVPLSSYQHES